MHRTWETGLFTTTSSRCHSCTGIELHLVCSVVPQTTGFSWSSVYYSPSVYSGTSV